MIKRFKQNEIDELVSILKNDGVIAVPTDTVYGLCARVDSEIAHNKLINLKKRPINKLFPIMCANKEQIKSIAKLNNTAERLIDCFMPGPITLILEKKIQLPSSIDGKYLSIAVRMATSKSLEELIKKVGSPIFMTSANISGEPPCVSLDEIEEKFPLLDGILEWDVPQGKASTIIDCKSEKIKILREGPISLKQIEEILKQKYL